MYYFHIVVSPFVNYNTQSVVCVNIVEKNIFFIEHNKKTYTVVYVKTIDFYMLKNALIHHDIFLRLCMLVLCYKIFHKHLCTLNSFGA